jgi:hypothetical protein
VEVHAALQGRQELSAVNQIIDIRDRLGGRYGYSVLVTSATDFYDADGNHVAASMVTITQFDPKSVRRGTTNEPAVFRGRECG